MKLLRSNASVSPKRSYKDIYVKLVGGGISCAVSWDKKSIHKGK